MLNKNEQDKIGRKSDANDKLQKPIPKEVSSPLTVFLHEEDRIRELFKGLKIADCSRFGVPVEEDDPAAEASVSRDPLAVSDAMTCSHCSVSFANRVEQVAHYKSDFHKYNLKRRAASQSALTEKEFDRLTIDDDILSVSGSESEDEEDPGTVINQYDGSTSTPECTSEQQPRRRTVDDEKENRKNQLKRHTKLFLVNPSRQMFCIYKCLIMSKWAPAGDTQVELAVKKLAHGLRVGIFLLAGGHFAAAVFSGGKAVLHKTFHSYTVRAKQGGSQASRDGRSATSHCRSAGASLRRYNEASLTQHIQELMSSWESELARCSLLFVHALGASAGALFSGKAAPLSRRDPRLRGVPFPTRRPTFSELERVYRTLAAVHVYGTDVDVDPSQVPQSPPKPATPARVPRRSPRAEPPEPSSTAAATASAPAAPSRRLTARDRRNSQRQQELDEAWRPACWAADSEDGERAEYEVRQLRGPADLSSFLVEATLDCPGPLDAPAVTAVEAQRNRRQLRRQLRESDARPAAVSPQHQQTGVRQGAEPDSARQATSEPDGAEEYRVQCYTACKLGDGTALESLLAAPLLPLLDTLRWRFGQAAQTLLHAAARSGHPGLVSKLLAYGADPTLRDAGGQTPYDASATKGVRNEFRRYRASHPDRHNYAKAHIPAPLTEEMEAEKKERDAEKKKLQNRKRKEKMIERKEQQRAEDAAMKEKAREEEERQRFLKLSDREKRALAAERRMASQLPGTVLVRCHQCASDMTGQVPFEYGNGVFCSTDCVRKHRTAASCA